MPDRLLGASAVRQGKRRVTLQKHRCAGLREWSDAPAATSLTACHSCDVLSRADKGAEVACDLPRRHCVKSLTALCTADLVGRRKLHSGEWQYAPPAIGASGAVTAIVILSCCSNPTGIVYMYGTDTHLAVAFVQYIRVASSSFKPLPMCAVCCHNRVGWGGQVGCRLLVH